MKRKVFTAIVLLVVVAVQYHRAMQPNVSPLIALFSGVLAAFFAGIVLLLAYRLIENLKQ
ncbi:MAG: hypothetical protein IIV43_01735 [Oscillospiraceae bacterium]|nr:hypothetical protein [Oscillospiraceae bacterium]